jgi:hypothetical protein
MDASKDLTVSAPIGSVGTRFDHDLTLRAGDNIVINKDIYLASRTLTLAANVAALDASRTLATLPDPGSNLVGSVTVTPSGASSVTIDTLGPIKVSGIDFTVQGGNSASATVTTTGNLTVGQDPSDLSTLPLTGR